MASPRMAVAISNMGIVVWLLCGCFILMMLTGRRIGNILGKLDLFFVRAGILYLSVTSV